MAELSGSRGGDYRAGLKRFLALDLELNQPSRKLIQVGVCLGHPLQSEEEYIVRRWYLDPAEPIAPEITALTGIDDATIAAHAVPIEQLATELGELLRATPDCFVNPVTWGSGDAEALLGLFREARVPFPHFGRRCIDVKTIHVALRLCMGRNANGGLSSAMGSHGLSFCGEAHRADVDAFNTLRFFFHLQARQRAMEWLLQLARSVR
jgi:hypothetical protein